MYGLHVRLTLVFKKAVFSASYLPNNAFLNTGVDCNPSFTMGAQHSINRVLDTFNVFTAFYTMDGRTRCLPPHMIPLFRFGPQDQPMDPDDECQIFRYWLNPLREREGRRRRRQDIIVVSHPTINIKPNYRVYQFTLGNMDNIMVRICFRDNPVCPFRLPPTGWDAIRGTVNTWLAMGHVDNERAIRMELVVLDNQRPPMRTRSQANNPRKRGFHPIMTRARITRERKRCRLA